MHIIFLILAILFEVSGTTSMKISQGFTRMIPSIMIFVFYCLSFFFLTLTLKKLELSIAYAIWAGLGTALIAGIGMIWFKEPVTPAKLVSIVLIILGVVGLNLSNGLH